MGRKTNERKCPKREQKGGGRERNWKRGKGKAKEGREGPCKGEGPVGLTAPVRPLRSGPWNLWVRPGHAAHTSQRQSPPCHCSRTLLSPANSCLALCSFFFLWLFFICLFFALVYLLALFVLFSRLIRTLDKNALQALSHRLADTDLTSSVCVCAYFRKERKVESKKRREQTWRQTHVRVHT